MKAVVLVCVIALAAVALARPGDGEHYTDRWDNTDVDEILSNEKITDNYVNCILGFGKCTPDAKVLRDSIEEALATNCAKCTEPQRKGTDKVMSHLINKKPEQWAKLKAKFDPEGKYAARNEERLSKLTDSH